jgi:hypothetical protein
VAVYVQSRSVLIDLTPHTTVPEIPTRQCGVKF